VNSEQVFFEVFKDVPFPFYAIDLGRLKKALSKNNSEEPVSHIVIPLDLDSSKTSLLAASWRGFLTRASVPYSVAVGTASGAALSKSGHGTKLLKQLTPNTQKILKIENQRIRWEEKSYWPLAFSTFLQQLYMVSAFHFVAINRHREETGTLLESHGWARSNVDFRSEYPRLLPTRQHFAFASLGAWMAGAINLQYFGYYATIRQIYHSELNCKYLLRLGFDEKTANEMDRSGLIGVPAALLAPLIEAQGSSQVFGSLPIDEQNLANPPAKPFENYLDAEPDTALRGLLIDKYYRSPFWSRQCEPHGLYGAATVFRDHYENFYKGLPVVAAIRCKHYSVPVVEVSSLDEIREFLKQIPIHNPSGLFFRGQTRMRTLQRNHLVKQLLFANSCSIEPSLTTSAARELNYDYDMLHFALRQFAEQSLYMGERSSIAERTERWRREVSSPTCKLDYAIMALAQHYGVPSHGLDVTISEDVATWFATNRYQKSVGGLSSYTKLGTSDWPPEPEQWPVLFACQTVTNSIETSLRDCEELEDFGLAARRPARQQAKFFHGGHSDHQNRLAEALVCVFRLRPGYYETESNFAHLFPTPDEDPAYKLMLEFATHNPGIWGHYINRFHE
jgi:hypothetical protein